MSEVVQHSGVVARVEEHRVVVRITSRSACGSCAARQACGLAEATEKEVEVYTEQAAAYRVGDAVMVGVRKRIGGRAVLIAYVGALVVLVGVLVVATAMGLNEGLAVVVTLGAVAAYYGVLWLFRKKIEHTIQFTITQI
ncbi:MAG: SoxR reducing system RseC family protein [Alistipes sp.]|nr:Fis family transcriptional regulator [Rikenellaceae bacterium]MBO5188650.1 SoxR reducing system RseC family protein [Alistipes sp.]